MTDLPLNPENPKAKFPLGKIILAVLKYTLLILCMGLMFGGGLAMGFVASLVKDQPLLSHNEMQNKIFSNSQTSFAYFNGQNLIGPLRTAEDRRLVKIGEVSPDLINAIIATEDRFFYEHPGVNVKGLSRAVMETLTGSPVQTGGSSLTQQLIKQTILTPEDTL